MQHKWSSVPLHPIEWTSTCTRVNALFLRLGSNAMHTEQEQLRLLSCNWQSAWNHLPSPAYAETTSKATNDLPDFAPALHQPGETSVKLAQTGMVGLERLAAFRYRRKSKQMLSAAKVGAAFHIKYFKHAPDHPRKRILEAMVLKASFCPQRYPSCHAALPSLLIYSSLRKSPRLPLT
jgi:hypothetical protein